jgi:hypothetical protein
MPNELKRHLLGIDDEEAKMIAKTSNINGSLEKSEWAGTKLV